MLYPQCGLEHRTFLCGRNFAPSPSLQRSAVQSEIEIVTVVPTMSGPTDHSSTCVADAVTLKQVKRFRIRGLERKKSDKKQNLVPWLSRYQALHFAMGTRSRFRAASVLWERSFHILKCQGNRRITSSSEVSTSEPEVLRIKQ